MQQLCQVMQYQRNQPLPCHYGHAMDVQGALGNNLISEWLRIESALLHEKYKLRVSRFVVFFLVWYQCFISYFQRFLSKDQAH